MGSAKDKHKTTQGLINLPHRDKTELVDGDAVMMAASPVHSKLQAGIAGIAVRWEEEAKRKISGGLDGYWILTEAATFYDEQNIFVHRVAAFEKAKLPQLPQSLVRVKPFWVFEVMPPSNWPNDTKKKRLILEKNGVPFYWLVDPERRSIQVFRLSAAGEHYQIADYVSSESGKVRLEPFTNQEIDLSELFAYYNWLTIAPCWG